MASIEKRGTRWRARIMVGGDRESGTFRTKQEAAQWALQRTAELSGTRIPDKTLADALTRYSDDVAPLHKGHRWEVIRLAALGQESIARKKLAAIKAPDFAAWRDGRLKQVSPATVAREMNLLRSVLRIAWKEWHWLRENPMADVKPPRSPPSRKRRISDDEVNQVMVACDLADGLAARTALQRTGLAFLFALETAMRAGEIVGMVWPDVAEKSVTLPRTKNGDQRQVPLSKRAREILSILPRTEAPVFALNSGTRDALWRRAVAGMNNLHFHDARAEAIWRLSKKLSVLELAHAIGHRDPKSLMLYYNTSADDLADRL